MGYVMEFEMCSLLFLIILTIRFFSMRKFHTRSNRIFGQIMCCAIFDILLDIVSSILIDNVNTVAPWLNYIVNTAFYAIQIIFAAIMFLYVIALSGNNSKKISLIAMIPAFVNEILLFTTYFTHLFFYIENTPTGRVYARGDAFYTMHYVSAFYMLITVITVLRRRKLYRKSDIRTIVSFIAIIAASVIIQVAFPRVLLTGVAISIAIFMMFLTMQNPETMLDSITGAFNYSALTEYLRVQITESQPMWIAAVDVGGIRRLNSLMGIRTGNDLLDSIGTYFNEICGRHATVFRMMGTRFIIISDNSPIHREIVDKITERFKSPWTYGSTGVALLATIRYCEDRNSFTSPEDVVNLIDLAYSRAAEEGFGTTKAIDTNQLDHFHRKGLVKDAISRAISTGNGFCLNYQPLYSVKDKRFCGAEALIRLNDPVMGQISPAEFIPIAEGTDLIYQIDRLVVKKACSFLKAHPDLVDSGLKLLEINLSATEFNTDTEKLSSSILSDIAGIENKICFEVTETAVTTKREVLSEFMCRLIDRGVRFAIDDFGTGYANITQLAKLPFSIVKLDRIFVSQNDTKETMILKDLVNMFDHIGLSTVFEGVETAEQSEFASGIGVDQIQGYYYSHPLSENEFLEFIHSANAVEGA